ncbi:hypothetical protein B4U80_11890 [Leptotrombidium deliense]|uniref:DNA-directed DNA polymerase n=1 Tax=Leptotrombidium deliense TaxID=299467 RepID=A0A443S194_9ACAR|nr:hypothetical protein B4U80_11890 [Leptotrombidium deliense]
MCRSKRVLYFDTDSIIFASKPGEYKPKLGEYLGEMTDEIVTEFGIGARIVEFVSCGPKNYGFHVILPTGESRYVLKCKGIRMSAEAASIITFKQMVEIATRYRDGEEVQVKVPQFNIYSDFAQNVYTKKFDKIYRAVSDKRRIVAAEMYTRPYGFVE